MKSNIFRKRVSYRKGSHNGFGVLVGWSKQMRMWMVALGPDLNPGTGMVIYVSSFAYVP